MSSTHSNTSLNAICPYYTMFPLEFPMKVLKEIHSNRGWVLDPFCGRGTTNFAARILGMNTIGIDSSPIAVALSSSKLVNTTKEDIVKEAKDILNSGRVPKEIPQGDFWDLMYDRDVLYKLCKLREELLEECNSDIRVALRAIILGALHGPQNKNIQTYFSNQAPRTFSPKPAYSVRYWKKHGFLPKRVNVLDIINIRADRYYRYSLPKIQGCIIHSNSVELNTFDKVKEFLKKNNGSISMVITSPPYYGMRTYIPDQWIRNWFLGGKPDVDYSVKGQIKHSSVEEFINQLRNVWINTCNICDPRAKLVIRFGGINNRKVDPKDVIVKSLSSSGWNIYKIEPAGNSKRGKRQADYFSSSESKPQEEYDVYAVKS